MGGGAARSGAGQGKYACPPTLDLTETSPPYLSSTTQLHAAPLSLQEGGGEEEAQEEEAEGELALRGGERGGSSSSSAPRTQRQQQQAAEDLLALVEQLEGERGALAAGLEQERRQKVAVRGCPCEYARDSAWPVCVNVCTCVCNVCTCMCNVYACVCECFNCASSSLTLMTCPLPPRLIRYPS